jgi:hypothetical protein
LLVLGVVPRVKLAFAGEVSSEQIDKVFKKEFLINVSPNVFWQLLHETLVVV